MHNTTYIHRTVLCSNHLQLEYMQKKSPQLKLKNIQASPLKSLLHKFHQ